jgi:hypothetical protein
VRVLAFPTPTEASRRAAHKPRPLIKLLFSSRQQAMSRPPLRTSVKPPRASPRARFESGGGGRRLRLRKGTRVRKLTHHDLSIGHPEGWADDSVVSITGPPRGDYSPSITITREELESEMSAAEYAAVQLEELRRETAGMEYRLHGEEPLPLPFAGVIALQRVHAFVIDELEVEVMQMQVYAVKGFEAVTITCTDTAEQFAGTRPTFLEAVRLFTWGGAGS